jgi:hypothetical protein
MQTQEIAAMSGCMLLPPLLTLAVCMLLLIG